MAGNVFSWKWNSLRSNTHFRRKKFPHHPALFGEVDIALLTGFKKKPA
ncbi:MAG: hypothetical protein ACI90S_001312, partial [Marinobacter psychrophilus]